MGGSFLLRFLRRSCDGKKDKNSLRDDKYFLEKGEEFSGKQIFPEREGLAKCEDAERKSQEAQRR